MQTLRLKNLAGALLLALANVCLGAAPGIHAAQPSIQDNPKSADSELGAFQKIRTLLATEYGGVAEDFEVRSIDDISLLEVYSRPTGKVFYTTIDGRHILLGSLFAIGSQTNMTRERELDLNRVPYKDLPKDRAIRIVKGTGEREFVVFEDPDCPFCRELDIRLDALENYTAYIMLFPLADLHPQAEKVANAIWCSENPAEAWKKYLRNQTLSAANTCETPVAELQQLAARYHISGTPTFVLPDGSLIEGLIDMKNFAMQLDGIGAKR